MSFDDPYYAEKCRKLTKCIIDHYNASWFKDKRVLDLGAGTGEIGNALARLGSEVIAVDARPQNIETIRKSHPHIKTLQIDLESSFIPSDLGSFDLVLSLGLINHLANWEKHLNDLCLFTGAPHIVLETEAYDTQDANFRLEIKENINLSNFSFSGIGSLISSNTIQSRLSRLNCKFQRKDTDILNTNYNSYKYDWAEMNSGLRDSTRRRLWFIHRDPLLIRKIQAHQTLQYSKEVMGRKITDIKPAAICFYGETNSTQLNLYKDAQQRYDVFVHTYNPELESELKTILNPVNLSTAQIEEPNPIIRDLFAIYSVNKIRNEFEQDTHLIYDSVIFRKFNDDPNLDYQSIKDYRAQFIGNDCVIANSLIGDILASAFEYREQLQGLPSIREILIKQGKDFYVPVSG